MTAKVILNPYSGRWSALRRKDDAMAALREAGVEFDLAVTEGPRHGIELAEEAARAGYSPIISAGYDGATGRWSTGSTEPTPTACWALWASCLSVRPTILSTIWAFRWI
jgi:diacylglycerol kinase family enzyme